LLSTRQVSSGVIAGLLQGIPAETPECHDELRTGRGALRESWQRFFGWLPDDALQLSSELDRRHQQLAQQVRVDGVTHNVYRAPGANAASPSRPWPLELLPLLLEPADWSVIERAAAQRAKLLNLMLADL
jgi:uncharacterized circularly permuted ATP-grasp superfamily protein